MALKNIIDTELAAKQIADWLASRWPDAQDVTSQLVAKLLDLPAPTGATTSFVGNRGQ